MQYKKRGTERRSGGTTEKKRTQCRKKQQPKWIIWKTLVQDKRVKENG